MPMTVSRISLIAFRAHFKVERIKTGWRRKCAYCRSKFETRSNTPDEHKRCRTELLHHLQNHL